MTQLQAPSDPWVDNCRTSTKRSATLLRRFATGDAVRLGVDAAHADESVVVVPSISIERTTPGSGTVMQAMEERAFNCCCPPAAAADDLRDLAAGVRIDRGVLPRVAPGDSESCPRPAHLRPGR